jgi:L-threonylcarbamoyladenylate synthase
VYVLEGGPCRGGIESTVVSLAGPRPRLLRPGLVSAEEISIVIGRPIDEAAPALAPGEIAPAPGMLAVHYAPLSPATMIDTPELPSLLADQGRLVLLTHTGLTVPPPHAALAMPREPGAYAARLYAALREADTLRPTLIAVERPPAQGPLWGAIADRLARATSPRRA